MNKRGLFGTNEGNEAKKRMKLIIMDDQLTVVGESNLVRTTPLNDKYWRSPVWVTSRALRAERLNGLKTIWIRDLEIESKESNCTMTMKPKAMIDP
jgi:hypothetical protein